MLLVLLAILPAVAADAWCYCYQSINDGPRTSWNYDLNSTSCDNCRFAGNATQIGCSNFSSSADVAAAPEFSSSTGVACNSAYVDWVGRFTPKQYSGADAKFACNQTTCCCPSGDFQITEATATSLTLKVGYIGKCGANVTTTAQTFSGVVNITKNAHTFLELGFAAGWPFGQLVLRGSDALFIGAGDTCGFIVEAPSSTTTVIIVVLVIAIVLVLAGVGVFMWRRKRTGYTVVGQ